MTYELSLAEERERRSIATDLHDQIGQTLSVIFTGTLPAGLAQHGAHRLLREAREALVPAEHLLPHRGHHPAILQPGADAVDLGEREDPIEAMFAHEAPVISVAISPDGKRIVTASQELHDKLERLQALMRTTVPDGDLGAIIDAAVTEKLERLEAKKLGKTQTPRKTLAETDTTPTSRYIPAPVRREAVGRRGCRPGLRLEARAGSFQLVPVCGGAPRLLRVAGDVHDRGATRNHGRS